MSGEVRGTLQLLMNPYPSAMTLEVQSNYHSRNWNFLQVVPTILERLVSVPLSIIGILLLEGHPEMVISNPCLSQNLLKMF